MAPAGFSRIKTGCAAVCSPRTALSSAERCSCIRRFSAPVDARVHTAHEPGRTRHLAGQLGALPPAGSGEQPGPPHSSGQLAAQACPTIGDNSGPWARAGAVLMLIALAALRPAAQERNARVLPPPADRTIDFVNDVKPILETSCGRCHARGRTKGGFSIESRETVLKEGATTARQSCQAAARSASSSRWSRDSTENVMPRKGSRLTPQADRYPPRVDRSGCGVGARGELRARGAPRS